MASEPIIHENFKSELSNLIERTASALFVVKPENFQIVYANDTANQLGVQRGSYCYQVNMGQEKPLRLRCQ